MVLNKKWPVLARHEQAAIWLKVWTDLGRAPRTIDAYARGLAEYLLMCDRDGIDPLTANRAHVASFVRELMELPAIGVRTWFPSTRARGLPMPRCSSVWCLCGCFTTA
jgi:hypothetical protein